MNALKSYSSDEDSDTSRPTISVKDGDPGTNYDSVGMDISEDSDEERSGENSKKDSAKTIHQKSNNSANHGNHVEKNIVRDHHEVVRESSSSGSSRDSREHSSRDSRHRSDRDRRRHRDGERGRHDRKRASDSYHRRGRDRSRSRERRSYHSRSRSRERHRRSRSKSNERRRPNDIRRDAQNKLAAMKAANPDFDQTDLLRQSMVEQIAQVEKQTGLTLPTYYNPATMNPIKLAEQERKKRLLWGNKKKSTEEPVAAPSTSYSPAPPADMQGTLWANTKFNNDSDGKMAEKFKRLMGVKPRDQTTPSEERRLEMDALKKQESMFVSMEKQYETARMVTHTQKGFGLGFSSQPYVPK